MDGQSKKLMEKFPEEIKKIVLTHRVEKAASKKRVSKKRPRPKKSDTQRRYESHPHVKAREQCKYAAGKKKDITEYWRKRTAAKRAKKRKKQTSVLKKLENL